MKTHEWYFAVADLGVDKCGNPCEAYVKMALDCEVDEQVAIAIFGKSFPDFEGRVRIMSRDEYIELAGEDDDENA